jgi:hypothetical protein
MAHEIRGFASPEMAEKGTTPISVVRLQNVDSTITPVEAGGADIAQQSRNRPEWIRLPRSGNHCVYTGLTRSAMNALILPSSKIRVSELVRSVCLRKRGCATGVRLVHLQSLLDYIAKEARNQPVVIPRRRKSENQNLEKGVRK